MIKNDKLKDAVQNIIFTFANKNPDYYQKNAEELINVIDKLMIRRKVKDLYEIKEITNILYSSAYLYLLFYDNTKLTSLFLLRETAGSIFDQHEIEKETQLRIFQMCEGFMGEDSVIDFLIPQKGYPDDLFADAVYILSLIKEASND